MSVSSVKCERQTLTVRCWLFDLLARITVEGSTNHSPPAVFVCLFVCL